MSRQEPKTYTLDGVTGTVRELIDHFQSKVPIKLVYTRIGRGATIGEALRGSYTAGFIPGNRTKANRSANKPNHKWLRPHTPASQPDWKPKG